MAFHHWDDKSCSWLFLLGPAPFVCLLCFSAGWRSAYLAGGSAFRLLWFLFVVFCAVDLPSYMTTGVNVGRTRGKKRLRKMRKMSFNCSISLMPVFGLERCFGLPIRSHFGSSPSRFKQLVATLTSSGGECQLQV